MKPINFTISYIVVPAICISMALFCCGCTDIQPADTKNGFVSDEALPAHEYNLSITQEVTTVLNQMTTHMTLADSIKRDEVDGELQKDYIAQSKDTISVCKDVIETLTPAKTYEGDRKSLLLALEQVLETFDKYQDAVDNDDKEMLDKVLSELKVEYALLTSLANVTYQ